MASALTARRSRDEGNLASESSHELSLRFLSCEVLEIDVFG
jgi:hypothetical protein